MDLEVQLIIIEEIPPVEIDGKTYKYQLVAGVHRLTALIKNHENRHQILKIHLNRIKVIIDKRNNFSILLVN